MPVPGIGATKASSKHTHCSKIELMTDDLLVLTFSNQKKKEGNKVTEH
jgi:hypothetical protein